MSICNTIIQQLGNLALSMLGAYMLVDLGDGLQFRIKGSEKVNLIQVILDPCDTYTLKFWKVSIEKKKLTEDEFFRLMRWEPVSSQSGIYFDMLHDVIEEATGLYVSLSDSCH